jgi:hypothetical protein
MKYFFDTLQSDRHWNGGDERNELQHLQNWQGQQHDGKKVVVFYWPNYSATIGELLVANITPIYMFPPLWSN